MKGKILLVISFFALTRVYAYKYGEHKEIGDQAFLQFILRLREDDLSGRQAKVGASRFSFFECLDIKIDSLTGNYYFQTFLPAGKGQPGSGRPGITPVSYGVLNGLSGDHESNPLALEEQLRLRSSVIQTIISLHNQYIALGYTAAPDSKLTKLDFEYALLAALNLSHFYEYGKTFQEQLRHFDKTFIRGCQDPARVEELFKKLNKTNAINMYVSLHAVAIDLAERSGHLARIGSMEMEAKKCLFYAFLFNGFADHFLEDAFSSGHLIVNRTPLASITNNKALHDFYCEHGTMVVNRKGQIWQAYGDGQFNNSHNAWRKETSLEYIQYHPYTEEASRIIEAVGASLDELRDAFQRSSGDTGYHPFMEIIPEKNEDQAGFLILHMNALQLVPIPYRSGLQTLLIRPQQLTDSMRKANQMLTYRNFVRSRVANSLVLGLNSSFFSDDYFKGWEIRVGAGSFLKKYAYNDKGGKKGVLDYWHGYTLAYSTGHLMNRGNPKQAAMTAHQILAGIKGNYDYWVSDRRFLGIYTYVDAGIQLSGHKTELTFVPSVGLQLGSLFNVNYYNMPTWLRLPAQYFLPLKLRYGSIIVNHQSPHYFSVVDLDIFF